MKEKGITFAISLPKSLYGRLNVHKNKSQFIAGVLEDYFKQKEQARKVTK